jgi:hypothetical protein
VPLAELVSEALRPIAMTNTHHAVMNELLIGRHGRLVLG